MMAQMLATAIAAAAPHARRILVVDDEPDIREAIQDLLEACVDDAQVVSAESGKDALAVLRDQNIDLILTDYRMPGMNGVKFLQEAEHMSPGIPHIILTAFDRDLIRELGEAGKRERIMQKPFEPEALIGLVENALAAGAG